MNNRNLILSVFGCVGLMLAAGCGTQQGSTSTGGSTAAPAANASSNAAPSTLEGLLSASKEALAQGATNQAQTLGTSATNQLQTLPATGTNSVAALLEKAKTLTKNEKYQDAMNTLSQLYASKLTADQKAKVDAVKDQIQAALVQKAAGMLNKQPTTSTNQ